LKIKGKVRQNKSEIQKPWVNPANQMSDEQE